MNRHSANDCQAMQDLIERFLDGELDALTKAVFESHSVDCAECAAELALARRVRSGLDALSPMRCPSDITEAVFAYARSRPLPARRPWWWHAWRPALAGGVAIVLLAITGYVGHNPKTVSPRIAQSELEQAQKQAKWTLVFINQLSRKAAANLKHEFLDPHVSRKLLRIVDPNQSTEPKEKVHES